MLTAALVLVQESYKRTRCCPELCSLGCACLGGRAAPSQGCPTLPWLLCLGQLWAWVNAQVRAQQSRGQRLPSVPVPPCQVELGLALGAADGWAEQGRGSWHLHAPSSSSRVCKGQELGLKQEKRNDTMLNPPCNFHKPSPCLMFLIGLNSC